MTPALVLATWLLAALQSAVPVGDSFATSLAPAGDVDGDGVEDLAVGCHGQGDRAGEGWVLSGRTGRALLRFTELAPSPVAIVGAGDVDLDGRADLLLAPFAIDGSRFTARLVSGRDGRTLAELEGAFPEPGCPSERRRRAPHLLPAGDVDGDGRADVVVGQRVLSGTGVELLTVRGELAPLAGPDVYVGWLRAASDLDRFPPCHDPYPWSDLDGDGTVDLLGVVPDRAGCPQEVVLVSGRTGELLRVVANAPARATLTLGADRDGDGHPELVAAAEREIRVVSSASGALLQRLDPPEHARGSSGWAFSRAWSTADLDGDGVADVVSAEARGVLADRAHVWSGRTGELVALHGCPAGQPPTRLDVAPLGDVDGDGVGDFAFGGSRSDYVGPEGQGFVRIVSGRRGWLLHTVRRADALASLPR